MSISFALNLDYKQHTFRSESKTKFFGFLKNMLYLHVYLSIPIVPTFMWRSKTFNYI